MQRNSRVFVAVMVACAPGFAQTDRPASAAGTVTNSLTGEPILRAHVTLSNFRRNPSDQGLNYGAMTDAKGQFTIPKLQAGTYFTRVEKNGFVQPDMTPGRNTNQVTISPGDTKDDIHLTLVPCGAILGHVLDGNGEPVEHANVRVDMGNGTTTDDKGQFRIGGLRPGKYRVVASLEMLPFPPEIRTDGTAEVHYSRTYYPSSLTSKDAGRVTVAAGAEVSGVDIRLVRTPIVRVSGKLTGAPPGGRNTHVQLQERGARGGSIPGGMVKPDGAFEIWRVDPGRYYVLAFAQDGGRRALQSAPVEIEVAETNVDNLELRLMPPFELSGTVQYEDEQAKPPQMRAQGDAAQAQGPGRMRGGGPSTLMLRWAMGMARMGGSEMEVHADGSFLMKDVQPGKYMVGVSWGGAYVKSMQLGPTPMNGATLDLSNGSGGQPLTVLLSSATGEISGMVRAGNDPAPGVQLTLRADPPDTGFMTFGQSKPDGSYQFTGLTPGKYRLAVLDPSESSAMMYRPGMDDLDDDGVEVSVAAGEKVTKDLEAPKR